MISRVPPPALSDLRSALRLACPARPLAGVQERRTAGAAARGRRAAPYQSPAPARLGRPSGPGRADCAPAEKAAGTPAGHPRHRPAAAPPPDHQKVDLSAPHGTTAGQRCGSLPSSSPAAQATRPAHGTSYVKLQLLWLARKSRRAVRAWRCARQGHEAGGRVCGPQVRHRLKAAPAAAEVPVATGTSGRAGVRRAAAPDPPSGSCVPRCRDGLRWIAAG